ncbi:MAG: virulence RhuM family protein, partial [Bacteroidales bacterium]|nr:virulence RhuM family protein [Bacteroidales bacterium]
MENENVWLTQAQIAELFGTKRPAITKHLNNIYKSGELEEMSTCSILEHVGNNAMQTYQTRYYSLDAILSVGYRVNSKQATQFRQWATQILKSYLVEGYVVNEKVLKEKNAELLNQLQTLSVLIINDIPIP